MTLKIDLSTYAMVARNIEERRIGLVERIMGVAKEVIIPEISQELPEGYSIDADKSGVQMFSSGSWDELCNRVSAEFYLDLRLTRDGKSIYGVDSRLGEIQHSLEPQLAELAQEYGLNGIKVMGEPLEV
ncbi:hypothetical protein CL618_00755 [archaeon]|nr:hypothetical protein [archaeon]|tara:strand:- start:370 stop:756 length:387 start_codon:yes stop_codon:yes gene_type:complete